ncbi:hypothetical protein SAMN05444372_10112 [Flavobacterium micromati]|uniref:Uncharacterized protein n=1 Tax=Flavobacterium micromati TaxID=229205 RepID=A0A1M5F8K0_9FLAO|nr:hypothetical protein SAMN05444372_10112 [Flavobacterium micromati]
MVFVFPVPVAPAINPWRFIVFRGTRTKADAIGSPSKNAPPRIILSPLKL